jgi:hypothetical protein
MEGGDHPLTDPPGSENRKAPSPGGHRRPQELTQCLGRPDALPEEADEADGMETRLAEELTGVDSSPCCPALGHLNYREAERRVEAVFVAVGADLLANLVLVVRAAVFDRVRLPAHGDHASPESEGPQRPACEAVRSYAITQLRHALLLGTMGATEDPAIRLYAVADDPALAMNACWRESVDGAFEAVKDMCCSSGSHLERLVVVVPAHLTDRH